MKKRNRMNLISCAIVVAVIVIIYASADIIAGHRLRKEIDFQAKAGFPMTIRDIAQSPISPDRNAAFDLEKAFAYLDEKTPQGMGVQNAVRVLGKLSTAAGLDFLYADDIHDTLDSLQMREAMNAIASPALAPMMALLDTASRKNACNFNYDLSKGIRLETPQVQPFRKAVRLVLLRAVLSARYGNQAGALDDICLSLRLCALMRDDPVMIWQMARIGVLNKSVRVAHALLRRYPAASFPSYGLTNVAALLSAEGGRNIRAAFIRALDAERVVFGGPIFQSLLTGGEWHRLYDASTYTAGSKSEHFGLMLYAFAGKPLIKTDYAYYLRYYDNVRVRFESLYYRAAEKSARLVKVKIPSWCIISNLTIPAFDQMYQNLEKCQARIALAQTGIAAAVYFSEHGNYPDSLPAPAIDPFSGSNLKYRSDKTGYVVYSVGANGIDDGGVGEEKGKDDLVWEVKGK